MGVHERNVQRSSLRAGHSYVRPSPNAERRYLETFALRRAPHICGMPDPPWV